MRARVIFGSIIGLIGQQIVEVQADPAFYCQNRVDTNLKGYGDVNFYEDCGDLCDCFVFELLCLKRSGTNNDIITLEQKDFAYADSCSISECICNI